MGTIASTRVYRNNPPLNTGEGLTILRNNQIALRELIGSLPPATITSVSSNTITPTSTMLIINVDATINTITSTVNLSGETTTDNAQAEQEFHDGAVIKIIATSGKTVTIGNSGNIQLLNNASSVTVSSTTPTVLTYNASTHKWVEHERVSELIGGVVGDLSKLTTAAKNTVVAAINEVDSNTDTNATNHSTLLSAVGNIAKSGNNITEISSQITRTSIIAAINDIVSKIGLPLAGLTTSVKPSIVAAINSLVSGKADKTEVGTLTDLTTTAKTSAVAAINELKSTYDTEIGTLSSLTTTNKDSVVSAINELNTGVVHTSGDETVAGNKTFSGTVDLTRTTDAGGTSTNKPALRIGSLSGKHLEFDGDEIMAKNTGNTVGQLNINLDGGLVKIGNGGLTVTGTITGNVTGDLTGTASNATNDVDGNAIKTTYAKLASPTFTGTPKAPTASASTNNTQIATTAFVKTAISNLISSAPTTLDTLNEIATALGNDPNFATTMTTQLGLKANDADVVHKTGDETIAGDKSFSANVFLKHNSVDHTATPTSDNYRGLYFTDKNDTTLARIMYYKNTTGITGLSIGLKANNGEGYLTGLSISATTDGEVRAVTSSSPALDDSSTKIATTEWVRNATGNFACNAATATKATQDEDGNTIKTTYAKLASPTFTGTPKAPTASASTNNTQIATTAFVKTAINDKANDSDVVHKTGDETVAGTKTFSHTVTHENNGQVGFSSKITGNATLRDYAVIDSNDKRISLLRGKLNSNGTRETQLSAIGGSSFNTFSTITVGVTASGETYATAPQTLSTGSSTSIVTKDYADAIDTNAVHKTGDETVAGEKTLSGNTTISKSAPVLSLQMLNLDTTQVSSSNKYYSAIGFCDKNGLNSKNRTAVIRSGMYSIDSNFIEICAVNPTVDSTAEAHLAVHYSRDGKAKAVAPSTLTADDVVNSTMSIRDTDIITRDFIPKDTRIVHTTGNEEIAGTKDFTDGITLKKNSDTIKVICSDLTKGTAPNSNKVAGFNVYANTSNTSNNTDRLGGFTVSLLPDGTTRVGTIAYKNIASDSSSYVSSYIYYPSSGSAYMTAPSTREGETTTTEVITRGYLDTHKVEKTYWRSRALNRLIAEAITATSTTPYTLTTTDFGSDYKEILFKFVHTSAQSSAATFKLKVYFSDNNTALTQINNFLSTAANNYLYLKIINNFGLAECYAMCATSGSLGAWCSLTGATGSVLPVIVDSDATITKVELYSNSSSVTQIPSGFYMYSWGRK